MPDGIIATDVRTVRHGHLFCGLGGGAQGFNAANPRVGNMVAKFECVGGIDIDAASIRDFNRLTGARGTVMDLFDREQYEAFYGHKPPHGWREATPDDVLKAFGYTVPHALFLSSPCKGLSGLLSEAKSKTPKYQALNRLTVRGMWLALEAYKDDPIDLIIFENVPRIATRGRHLVEQILALLRAYGYAAQETTHDCGEIGALAQSRKRFLLVARHMAKVPPCLYVPRKHKLRGVGEVLGLMPMPGSPIAGPMHRIPSLQWQTWVRLAFVRAGSDWRSLKDLRVSDGHLQDYLMVPEMRSGVLGVTDWDDPACTVAGRSSPSNNAYSVADPRMPRGEAWQDGNAYGVVDWDGPSSTIAGQQAPGQGRYAVSDPRPAKMDNCFRIIPWGEASREATAGTGPSAGGLGVADPRPSNNRQFDNIYTVTSWEDHSRTVIGRAQPSDGGLCVADPRTELRGGGMGVLNWTDTAKAVAGESLPSNGAFAVADPRPSLSRVKGDDYLTAGHYGVVPWQAASGAVSSSACHDNGHWSVADPRLPAGTDRLVCRIRALDGTWHRPFTTLELAALQSLVDPEACWQGFYLDGSSDQAHRERIGNAVPSNSAKAIAETMGRTLLMAWSGERFFLSANPIWVQPIDVALSVMQPGEKAP
jgi:site-specific DNA-cytosine methylase